MAVGDPYLTLAELKDALGISASDEDDIIERALNAARSAIEKRCGGRSFWKTATAETRTVSTRGKIRPVRSNASQYTLALVPDIASSTSFAVAGYSAAALISPAQAGEPYTSIRLPYGTTPTFDELSITAFWGWESVPDDIIWANQMQAMRYYRRRGSPEGVAGSAEWGLISVPRLDPDVRGIVDQYRFAGIG